MADLNLFKSDNKESPLFAEDYYKEKTFENIHQTEFEIKEKEFYKCTFKNVMLNFSTLNNCCFESCIFTGCDFSLAQFKSSSFLEVNFVDCKLVGIDWAKTAKPFKVDFKRCKMNDSIFFEMDLRGFNFESCEIHNTDFERANLSRAQFCDSDLLYTKFNGANLSNTDFFGAINYLINPTVSNIKKAKFSLPEAMSLLSHLDIIIK